MGNNTSNKRGPTENHGTNPTERQGEREERKRKSNKKVGEETNEQDSG